MKLKSKHHHGGQLQVASLTYNIPLTDWLDLSTGISPFIYPLPSVPDSCWQRLPEANDGLESAASAYYGSAHLLPVSGSQEAIQRLPSLFPRQQKIGIVKPAYHSHQQAWQNAGHCVTTLASAEIEAHIPKLDVLILVNPTNPSTEQFSPETVMYWHQRLSEKGGYLLIDEAFMDATPEQSVISNKPTRGLIVFRSIGKFFGLAGIRLGFVWAETEILQQLANRQDDWSVSHPARWAGKLALQDSAWQQQQRKRLHRSSIRLQKLLEQSFQSNVHHTALFAYFRHEQASHFHEQLAKNGILTRLFQKPLALRFGLPETEEQWQRLEFTLEAVKNRG